MKTREHYRGREQTYLKHFFLERYLERVALKVGWFADDFVYVDAFSGPWRTEDPTFEDSSFVIATRTLQRVREILRSRGRAPSIRCVFVESDAKAFSLLKQATAGVQDLEILTINSEFELAIQRILEYVKRSFTLVFIDPKGWTGFGLKQIGPILHHRPGEVIVNFMFDHINRFLDSPSPEMSFDELFGGSGWKATLQNAPAREDAVIDLYCRRMKELGDFEFVTSTRIKKPLAERSYFYLVYGTRHHEGLLEFRNVEEKEIEEQERVRLSAKQLNRMVRTGQQELFTDTRFDRGPLSFEQERVRNLRSAEKRLIALLADHETIDYVAARSALMETPLVWEGDVRLLVLRHAEVVGLKPRERTPKVGHQLRRKDPNQDEKGPPGSQ